MALTTVDQGLLGPNAQYTGFKNRLINGAMNVWQRGTSFTLSSGVTTYTADRWYVNTTGGSGVVTQTGSLGAYSLRLTGASGVSSGFVGQKIESVNIADLAGSTVTYKIRASSSVLTSLTWYARFPTAQDNYASVTVISSGTINITSTPTDYTFQIALPSGANNGLEVYFSFGAFTSGTLDLTLAQLEKGSTATSFDYRPYGAELALCQRYYQTISDLLVDGWNFSGGVVTCYKDFIYPVVLRATPTVAINGAVAYAAASAYAYNSGTANKVRFQINIAASNYGYGYGAPLSFSAEL